MTTAAQKPRCSCCKSKCTSYASSNLVSLCNTSRSSHSPLPCVDLQVASLTPSLLVLPTANPIQPSSPSLLSYHPPRSPLWSTNSKAAKTQILQRKSRQRGSLLLLRHLSTM